MDIKFNIDTRYNLPDDLEIIADNAGGITVQSHNSDYAHHYQDGAQAGKDIADLLLHGGDMEEWEGNEYEDGAAISPTDDELRNGCYRNIDLNNLSVDGWHNERDFAATLIAALCNGG